MDLFDMSSAGFWITVVLSLVAIVVGIRAYKRISIEIEFNQKEKMKRQAIESELRAAEDEFRAEQQRFEKASAARPVFLPEWAERKVSELHDRIGNSHADAKWKLLEASDEIENCEFGYAKAQLEHFDRYLDNVYKDIYRLAGIETWVMRFRRNAERKSAAALSLAEEVEEFGKAMSDQGVMLNIDAFDDLSRQVLWLQAFTTSDSGELLTDRSDEILRLAEKLISDAEELQHSLEYVATLRAYVPKRIAEHQHRPGDLMSRNGDAVRTLERIKSSSAAHLWFGLDQQLKEVPGMLTRAKLSFALASEMHAAQSWSVAKQEAEAAVALANEAESIFDKISELDARLSFAQETVTRYFGETKIAVMSAVRMVKEHEDVSVTAKQLAIRARCAFERASYLISAVDAFDYIGAVESLGHARQFAEAALDRAKLDTAAESEVTQAYGGCGVIEN